MSTAGSKDTGERVTTSAGGFNPTYQRHVAAYRHCAPLLDPGPVLDLGCGIGHSISVFNGPSIGLDRDQAVLRSQQRSTVAADMRRIPLADGAVSSVLSIQSLEHVPDPLEVLREAARVVHGDGASVFVTPNRLTFAKADEVIDPWHFIEWAPDELLSLCLRCFLDVKVFGLHGSDRYLELQAKERRRLHRLLRLDPLRFRRYVPRRLLQWAYGILLSHTRRRFDPRAAGIGVDDFRLSDKDLDECLDVIAVCRRRRLD